MSPLPDTAPLPTGWFRLEVWRAGRLLDIVDEQNAITIGYRDAAAAALGGLPGAVTQIGYGTGTTPGLYGNTGLLLPFVKPIDSATLLGSNTGKIVFGFTLAAPEANGLAIGEFGLLTAAGVLVARKARRAKPIVKDITISLQGTWTIEFKGA